MPVLAVGVILFGFLVNIAGSRSVGLFSLVMAAIKIGGIALFGVAALWARGFSIVSATETGRDFTATGFVASVALAVLAFEGFTTVTNSGAEITGSLDPQLFLRRSVPAAAVPDVWSEREPVQS